MDCLRELMARDSTKTAVRIGLMTAVTLALMLLAVWPHKRIYLYGENDFLAIYAGAKLAFSDRLYDPEAVRQAQIDAAGATGEILRFSRLPGYAMLLSPLRLIPYLPAYAVWQLINLAAVIGAVALWPYRRSTFATVLSVCLPLYIAFAGGQDVSFILLGMAAFFRVLESERFGWAGLALGICLVKFHFIWGVGLVLLRHRRYRTILGLGAAAALFVLPGFLVNFDWPLEYYSAIVAWRVAVPKTTYTLFPFAGWAGLPVAAALAWIAAMRFSLSAAACTAVALAVLVSPNGYVADYTLMAPLLALIFEKRWPATPAGAIEKPPAGSSGSAQGFASQPARR
jgi:hypothetical protein